MPKGYYISKPLARAAALLFLIAVIIIIALSAAYSKEKAKNAVNDKTASPVPTEKPPSTDPWDQYRLPNNLSPLYYNVTLWPRLTPDAQGIYLFSGNSSVSFTCLRETQLILIHCHKLNLTLLDGWHAKLMPTDGAAPAPQITRTWFQEETQYLVIRLKGALEPGKEYRLYTEFRGELADDLEGFYRSEYEEDDTKK